MRPTLWQASVWAVLGVGLVLTPASAKPIKVNSAKKATNELVTSLHQAKVLLESAAHDYDGHRAKAVEHISHALHELAPNHKHKNTAAKGTKEGPTPGETQAQSDEKLKQAQQILAGLDGNLGNATAATHLKNAIGELNIALKVK